jgi:Tfp pilus assembly protein FimT
MSIDSQICGGTWSDGWLMFADQDGDEALDVVDEIIVSGSIEDDVIVDWVAFGSDNYIRLTPRGMMLAQNGTFTPCPENVNQSIARTVVVSKLVRVRLPDTGTDADGKLITCN